MWAALSINWNFICWHTLRTETQLREHTAMATFSGFCCALCCMGNDSIVELLRWATAHPASATALLVLLDGATKWKHILAATQEHPAHEHAIESFMEGIGRAHV